MTGPNTFLIGAPKCGTTALAQFIADHPDGFLGYPKEPSYWSDDLGQGQGVTRLESLEDYLAIYADGAGGRVRLDASTRYLFSDTAVARILAFAPTARFIVMLRNPVALAQAYHMEKCFNAVEDVTDFETAWRLQDARARGEHIPKTCPEPRELQYGAVAAIGTQLDRVTAQVPKGQLLVLFQDELSADAPAVWRKVQAFLDLPEDGRTEFPVVGGAHFNRFPALARLYQQPPGPLGPPVRWMKKQLRTQLSGGALARVKGLVMSRGKRAALSPAFQAELETYFAPEIDLLERLTDRDLSGWRTQGLTK